MGVIDSKLVTSRVVLQMLASYLCAYTQQNNFGSVVLYSREKHLFVGVANVMQVE
jgi:hypothetical protein